MKVIICDDDKKFVDCIWKYFEQYGVQNQKNFFIYPFSDAEMMFEFYKKFSDISIVVLDVIFPYSDGIEIAERIRKQNSRTRIIFVSSFEKYAVKGYGIYADGYLLKPISYEKFAQKLDEVLPRIKVNQEKILVVNTDQGKVVIDQEEILFIETFGRKTKIHTAGGEFVSHQKMREYEAKLSEESFCRCHNAYIVNFQYIHKIENYTVVLKNGSIVLISKNRKKNFMAAFTKYMSLLIK